MARGIELTDGGGREEAAGPKMDRVPVAYVTPFMAKESERVRYASFAGQTDDAGTLVLRELEAMRDTDGDITGFRQHPQGRVEAFAAGEWRRLSSAWEDVERGS